jgi:isoleucyl-tRNA synthetase
VTTAGWTLDEQGRAMSKSLGNGVDPVDIADRMGGEIVRLWVASIDFREDMAASENLMQRCAELYRKVRNTFRFLLGNLKDFDPARDRVSESELLPLDLYMLARTRDLTEKIRGWYEEFEFHRVYQAINDFAIVDLSSFYLDVLKDRMYTFAPTSHARHSAQTVLWQITETLVRLVAPIMSFTADEVWEYLPKLHAREESVHLVLFPKPEAIFRSDPVPILERWRKLFEVRDAVLRKLEEKRQAKEIGKGLEADVLIDASSEALSILQCLSSTDLKEFFNVSAVKVEEYEYTDSVPRARDAEVLLPSLGGHIEIRALPAAGHKCARCWNFMPEVSSYGIWQNVCTRCHGALHEMGIPEPPPEPPA